MARIYFRSGAVGSPDEGHCSTKPEQRKLLQTRPRMAQTKRAASIGTAPTHLAPLEVQSGAPAANTEYSGKSHPALVALTRLLARQAAAELSDEPAATHEDEVP